MEVQDLCFTKSLLNDKLRNFNKYDEYSIFNIIYTDDDYRVFEYRQSIVVFTYDYTFLYKHEIQPYSYNSITAYNCVVYYINNNSYLCVLDIKSRTEHKLFYYNTNENSIDIIVKKNYIVLIYDDFNLSTIILDYIKYDYKDVNALSNHEPDIIQYKLNKGYWIDNIVDSDYLLIHIGYDFKLYHPEYGMEDLEINILSEICKSVYSYYD